MEYLNDFIKKIRNKKDEEKKDPILAPVGEECQDEVKDFVKTTDTDKFKSLKKRLSVSMGVRG